MHNSSICLHYCANANLLSPGFIAMCGRTGIGSSVCARLRLRVCDRACTIFLTHSVAQRRPTFPRPDARWLECKLYAVPHDCVASRRVHHKYISAIPCTVILYLRANAFGCRARRRPRGFSGLMLSGIFCVAFALIDCGRRSVRERERVHRKTVRI